MISEQTICDALAAEAAAVEVPRRAAAAIAALAAEPHVERRASTPHVPGVRRSMFILAGTLAAGMVLGAGLVGPLRSALQSGSPRDAAKNQSAPVATSAASELPPASTSALGPDRDGTDESSDAGYSLAARARSTTFVVTVDASTVDEATDRVVAMAYALNGTVELTHAQQNPGSRTASGTSSDIATVNATIPIPDFSVFAAQLSQVGAITTIGEREVDVQSEYESLVSRRELLDQTITAYQADIAAADGTDNVQTALQQLADALQRLAAVEGRLRELRETTRSVTVTVILETSRR